jgi:hypothetical protein
MPLDILKISCSLNVLGARVPTRPIGYGVSSTLALLLGGLHEEQVIAQLLPMTLIDRRQAGRFNRS